MHSRYSSNDEYERDQLRDRNCFWTLPYIYLKTPMINSPAVKYEVAEKQQAIACGGIGNIMQLIKKLELRKHINDAVPLFKLHLP